MVIIPAILATTEDEYQSNLKKIEDSNEFEWVQIDLMDNKFVQNQSISPEIVAKYSTNLTLEFHLMVEYPDNWIEQLVNIPHVKRIIFPLEDSKVSENIALVKNHGLQVGLSINPETNISFLEPFLTQVNLVLIMGVHPGFQGQEFIPETLKKIKELTSKRVIENLGFKIEVDGGINTENVKSIVSSGADYLVVGSHLLEGNIRENVEQLKESING